MPWHVMLRAMCCCGDARQPRVCCGGAGVASVWCSWWGRVAEPMVGEARVERAPAASMQAASEQHRQQAGSHANFCGWLLVLVTFPNMRSGCGQAWFT